ncbi:MAG: nitrile hydratase subunit beta [Chloroflexi bacterium]|nr:nitrile hydratase subunit beta [Chloroflexota bacterium]
MKRNCVLLVIYLIGTIVIPFLLFYPSMIYLDLAGMGGYDGFASHEMMMRHGIWSATERRTFVYLVFQVVYFVWLLSIANFPIAIGVIIKKVVQRQKGQMSWQSTPPGAEPPG